MRIVIEKEEQSPEQMDEAQEGRRLVISNVDFDDVERAKAYLDQMQAKYGKIVFQDYFSPETGNASFYTKTVEDGSQYATYWFYLDGFEGDLFRMIKAHLSLGLKRLSSRDIRIASRCTHCDYEAQNAYDLTEHENEQHRGMKPSWNFGDWAKRLKQEKNLNREIPINRPNKKRDRRVLELDPNETTE